MAAGDYQNTRYSSLNEINNGNVSGLRLAWSFETGLTRGHEAAPLVIGDTMYVVTPFPNMLFALDLRNKGAKKWVFHPNPAPAATR
jgi:alcohol dehydrogenase (cytochrome c)